MNEIDTIKQYIIEDVKALTNIDDVSRIYKFIRLFVISKVTKNDSKNKIEEELANDN